MEKFQNLGMKIAEDDDKGNDDNISIVESSRKSNNASSNGSSVGGGNDDFSSLGSVGVSSADDAKSNSNSSSNSNFNSDNGDDKDNESLSSAGGLVRSSRNRKRRNGNDFGQGLNDFARKIHKTTEGRSEDYNDHFNDLNDEEINIMKLDVIYKLQVLNNAGYPSPREFSVLDNYTTLEMELKRLQTLETMSYGLQLMRWGLVNGVSMIEACNENFKLTPLRLKGWSTSIHRKSHQLDPVLMELYQQWAYRVQIGPFSKLIAALLFSAVNCHMSNMIRDGSQKEGSSDDYFSNLMGNFSKMMGRNNSSNSSPNNTTSNDGFVPTPAPGSGSDNKEQQQQPSMRGPSTNFNKS